MKFPPMAIISIMHRISGVLLFLLLPFVLYLLRQSLHSQENFTLLQKTLSSFFAMKFFVWVLISAVCFHFFAGIRHMLMDCGFGEDVKTARLSAYFVMALEVIAMIFIGVWLW